MKKEQLQQQIEAWNKSKVITNKKGISRFWGLKKISVFQPTPGKDVILLQGYLSPSRKSKVFFTWNKFLVSEETVVLRRWERSKQKFGFIKRVDKDEITTEKDLESWRFER